MKMLLAGGGTGGHLFPAIAIAEQLLREDAAAAVRFVGTAQGLEARLLPRLGLQLDLINMVGVVGRGLRGLLQGVPRLISSFAQSKQILRAFGPDIVVGVGGYASFPVLLAAATKGIPCVLHEQNAHPGLSNRILARVARRICTSIPGSEKGLPPQKVVLTGNPLRQGVLDISAELPEQGCLLVFGGSRGARAINQLMVDAMPQLRAKGFKARVLHQTGEADEAWVKEAYAAAEVADVEVRPFIENMAEAYAEARLVVCRAGATTIAELCACGRPAVMIPFPFAAADHQTANAAAMAQQGAAMMLPQKSLDAEGLVTELGALWHDPERLARMASAAAALGQKDAAAQVLQVCRQVLTKG